MKKILLTLIMGLFLISFVSAFEFDNIKSFDDKVGNFGIVEIRNSVLGLEWFQLDRISTIKLLENTEQCNSEGCEAVKEIIMYENGKLIDDVRFMDLETGLPTNIKSYEIYVNGDLYNGEELEGSFGGTTYDVELKGEVYPYQQVD